MPMLVHETNADGRIEAALRRTMQQPVIDSPVRPCDWGACPDDAEPCRGQKDCRSGRCPRRDDPVHLVRLLPRLLVDHRYSSQLSIEGAGLRRRSEVLREEFSGMSD